MIHFKKIKYIYFIFIINAFVFGQEFKISRIHYGGGGDWYSDPSSLPNLLNYLSEKTTIVCDKNENKIKLTDPDLYLNNYLYITGHGNIRFTEDEVEILREHLLKGAFLHADDNYGMDKSFRREMKRVFPDKEWVELPHDHLIFNSFYIMPNGLPKIHQHDGNPPAGLGLFDGDRLILFYSYESDLGDGWEDSKVHNNDVDTRESALKMGVNIIWFALTQ